MQFFTILKRSVLVCLIITLSACGGSSDSSTNSIDDVPPPTSTADLSPDAFSFLMLMNADLGVNVESLPITVSGINVPTPVSVEGGEYKVNDGAFTSNAGEVSEGDVVVTRHVSSELYLDPNSPDFIGTASNTLTIGDKSAVFRSFAIQFSHNDDVEPDSFTLDNIYDVPPDTLVMLPTITIHGTDAPVKIASSSGAYAINGGEFMTGINLAEDGDTVTLRVRSPSTYASKATEALAIGSRTAVFEVHTMTEPSPEPPSSQGVVISHGCEDINYDNCNDLINYHAWEISREGEIQKQYTYSQGKDITFGSETGNHFTVLAGQSELNAHFITFYDAPAKIYTLNRSDMSLPEELNICKTLTFKFPEISLEEVSYIHISGPSPYIDNHVKSVLVNKDEEVVEAEICGTDAVSVTLMESGVTEPPININSYTLGTAKVDISNAPDGELLDVKLDSPRVVTIDSPDGASVLSAITYNEDSYSSSSFGSTRELKTATLPLAELPSGYFEYEARRTPLSEGTFIGEDFSATKLVTNAFQSTVTLPHRSYDFNTTFHTDSDGWYFEIDPNYKSDADAFKIIFSMIDRVTQKSIIHEIYAPTDSEKIYLPRLPSRYSEGFSNVNLSIRATFGVEDYDFSEGYESYILDEKPSTYHFYEQSRKAVSIDN